MDNEVNPSKESNIRNEIRIFEDQDVRLEVTTDENTVWLNSNQIAELFGRDYSTIRKHINNALSQELENVQKDVVRKVEATAKHGAMDDKTQKTEVKYYNLDVILSVGYRVKSRKGVKFRKWANEVLKDYLINGYAINQKRLEYLEKTIKLIDIASRIDSHMTGDEAKKIINIINNYSNALDLLDDYDHKSITKPDGATDERMITYEECKKIIDDLKYSDGSELFAVERNDGLKAIIGSIYQTYSGEDLYPTVQEKAANFLYMIVKNHVFIDGNKRIAAALFIYFLQYYGLLIVDNNKVIDNNTLVALTLLIAQSNPHEKDILIDLVMNFLSLDSQEY